MFVFPYPVIAVSSGHAVAKGTFLLLATDYRIGVDGASKIGLNEVAIGMTMHLGGVELAHHKAKLKVPAELLQVLDECIEKDRHGSL